MYRGNVGPESGPRTVSILEKTHESKGAPKLTAPIPISDHLRSGVSSFSKDQKGYVALAGLED